MIWGDERTPKKGVDQPTNQPAINGGSLPDRLTNNEPIVRYIVEIVMHGCVVGYWSCFLLSYHGFSETCCTWLRLREQIDTAGNCWSATACCSSVHWKLSSGNYWPWIRRNSFLVVEWHKSQKTVLEWEWQKMAPADLWHSIGWWLPIHIYLAGCLWKDPVIAASWFVAPNSTSPRGFPLGWHVNPLPASGILDMDSSGTLEIIHMTFQYNYPTYII